MIENTYWHENVKMFVDALNEIEQLETLEKSAVIRAVSELLIALDSAATLRLEAKAAAVHAMRDGTIGEREYQAIMGAANL